MKKFLIYYFLLLCSTFIFLSSGVIDSQDGFQYLAVARNIYYHREPTAPINEEDTGQNVYMSTYVGADGKTYSPTGLGYSLAFLPSVFITDLVYKYYNINPPVHFPLESDWLIFLLASLTNGFFASLLGVVMFMYFITLRLQPKQALLMSALSLFTTNLLVYGKHSVAHMMFVSFLLLSFLAIKKYSLTKSKKALVLAGIFYGIVSITYNITFVLTLPPLIIYCLLLSNIRLSLNTVISALKNSSLFLLGMFPFLIVYFWFENTRTGVTFTDTAYLSSYAKSTVSDLQVRVFIEGLYGQLLSPGRSMFLYSPLLLIILFFWHKIRSLVKPELITFLSLAIVYIVFYAAQYSTGGPDQGVAGLWHGESSWGPRYLTPLIPFGMLIVGSIFTALSRRQKILVFLPLAVFGLYIEMLGILMPYQIKYHDLQRKFYVNSTEYPVFVYSDLLPRYTPILQMSKKLVKLWQTFPKTLDHGIYNVRFYDGIDFPFNVGPEKWRAIEGTGYISFGDNLNQPIQKMAFGAINHPLRESSSSAHLQFTLNNHPLLSQPETLSPKERKLIEIPIKKDYLFPTNNQLVIRVQYDDPRIALEHSQIIGLINYSINDQPVNMESIDVPYVSPLGPKITGITYQNYGGQNQNLWKTWQIHTQIFERVPDFWWTKAMYYWDFPKSFFLIAFLINIGVLLITARKVYLIQKKF